jgi:serine/threonine protein kinase
MFINEVKLEKKQDLFCFSLSSENKMLPKRVLSHRSSAQLQEWISALKQAANSTSFSNVYQKGRKLGRGKFSTVFQCKHNETQEVVAVKQIDKNSLSDKERDFLREENQIIRLISHPNIAQMRETYETENIMHIVME